MKPMPAAGNASNYSFQDVIKAAGELKATNKKKNVKIMKVQHMVHGGGYETPIIDRI